MEPRRVVAAAAFIAASAIGARAGEVGHYAPGMMNVRDFFMPDPGFYGLTYAYYYTSDRINDRRGNRVRSVSISPGPGPGVTLDVDTDLDLFALAPTFIWVSDFEVLGARYAALIAPSFASTSVSASLTSQTGRGVGIDDGQFNVGDLFVEPLWLGWPLKHWDFSVNYAFYAPTGTYSTDSREFPLLGVTVKTPAADNVGLGFWTHQFQGAAAWYPWEHRGTAVAAALTYEIHDEKEDFDITPGSHLTLNWGASQYLPLTGDENLLLECGPSGYSQWQVTDDRGSDAVNGDVHDEVHGVGAQIGLTYVPMNAALNVRYLYEFASEDRFQGQTVSLSAAVKF
jgi:hypothetical protein